MSENSPQRSFFHSRSTISIFKIWDNFHQKLLDINTKDVFEELSSEIWCIHCAHARYFTRIRLAGWLLVIAAILLFLMYILNGILSIIYS